MTEDLKKRIFATLQKEMHVDPASLDPDSDFREKINIDSMQFVTLMARLENEFDIEIPISAMEATTLNEFLGILNVELEKKAVLR